MLAIDRRKAIMNVLTEKKSAFVTELSKMLQVTEETIRRDLEKLEDQGLLLRTHGGAVLAGGLEVDTPVGVRQVTNVEGKDRIGRAAAGLVRDGETIMLDASTSAFFLAKNIKDKKGITVITNSHKIVDELGGCENITVISSGGLYSNFYMSYTGRMAADSIRSYYASKAFISCKGVALSRGLTDNNEQEVDIKRAMIHSADQLVCLVDHMKIGKIGFASIASLEQASCFITDYPLSGEWEEGMRQAGVKVIVT